MIPVHALQVVNDLLLTLVGANDAKELTAGFLQRLMYHTGFPVACLMSRSDGGVWVLERVLGNRELSRLEGETLDWFAALAEGPSEPFEPAGLEAAFASSSRYRHGLRLIVAPDLTLVLLGPSAPAHAKLLPALFEAVLPRLDKARRLLSERTVQSQQLRAEIERRRRVEASLRESESRALALLDLSPQPMFVVDLETRQCIVVNARARELTGLAPTESLDTGTLYGRLIPDPNYRKEIRDRLRFGVKAASRKDGLLEPIAVRIRDASGAERRAEIHVRVVSGRALLSIIDVTERLRHEQALRAAKDLAERLSSAKSQYLVNASNELRPPLLAILGSADELARDASASIPQQQHAARIQDAGQHLLAFVEELIDLGHLESEAVALDPQVIDGGHASHPPQAAPEDAGAGEESDRQAESVARILIAEDQPMNQRLLKLQLEQLGRFELTFVSNGLEALQHLASSSFDLLLTDCNMPIIDGYRLTELVRAQEAHFGGHLPIVAITASALEEDVNRCLAAGMDACLAKPLSVGTLASAVRRWQPSVPRNATRPRREGYLLAVGSMVGELGHDALENLLDDFFSSSSELMQEGRIHLGQGMPEGLSQVMHKLKPTAALVGAHALAAAAELVERAGRRKDLTTQQQVWPALEALWERVERDFAKSTAPVPVVAAEQPPLLSEEWQFDLRALVIDDDPFTTRYVSNMLSELGVSRIGIAEDGARALERMQTEASPDVVLCDLAMPGMDGIELIRHLAEQKLKPNIIFMSGAGERVLESVEALARQYGFTVLGTLKKPVGREALATLLRRFRPTASRRMARVAQQTAVVGAPRPSGPAQQNREATRVTPEEVAQAIAKREITVHFQPKVRADSLQPIGVEALARWVRPDGSFISPGVFIPIVESHGLHDALLDLVLELSLDAARRFAEQGYPLKVSVNVSAASLERLEFVSRVLGRARMSEVDPRRLVLEVTETGLVRDQRIAVDVLTRLRLHGIELSIDDFGTGYSSIDLLRRVPFTELKVDRSFISNCVRDQSARHIISSSVGLARGLGMMVVAEGVETAIELATVRELGCDEIQGYYTGRPMAETALLTWLAEHMQPVRTALAV